MAQEGEQRNPQIDAGAAPPTFGTPQSAEPEERNWLPYIIALVLIAVVVGGIVLLQHNRGKTPTQVDPYAQYLKAGPVRLSAADNFVGATVTYIDFDLSNTGTRTVTGGRVEATFYNTLNEVVQREVLPLRVLTQNPLAGYPDMVEMSMAPIAPGKTRTVRLTVDVHISADWNQSQPALRFLNITTK